VLGPVRATPSHPNQSRSAGNDSGRLLQARMPVYALGGIFPSDLEQA